MSVHSNTQSYQSHLVYEPFLQSVKSRAEWPALISRRRTLTYAQLEQLSRGWARELQERGADRNTPVAIVMEKGWEQVVGVLAVLRAGAPYLPIDADLPTARIEWMLKNAGVRTVLTQSKLDVSLQWPDGIVRVALDVLNPPADAVLHVDDRTSADMAYVMYTSGSTGTPKGVMIAHDGIVNCISETNATFQVGPQDRTIAITALHHDMSVYDIFGMLAAGGAICIPTAAEARDPSAWISLIDDFGVTIWNSVPAFLQLLLDQLAIRSTHPQQRLRLIFAGGDWIPLSAPAQARKYFGGIEFVSVGGPTETTVWNIWYRVKEVDPAWKSIPYGGPIPNVQYYVLDEALQDCPVGITGELCCSGAGLMLGYLNDEIATQCKFAVHAESGKSIYRTGDLGRWMTDGNIEFVGRRDNQVKISGLRIELGEIESTLIKQPGVLEAAVLVRTLRDHEKQLVAAVRVVPGVTIAELAGRLRSQLPAALVPAPIRIVEKFPLNSNGKVDRPALLGIWERVAKPVVMATGAWEQTIALVWSQVLELNDIPYDVNFFDLGGKSVHLLRVMAQLAEQYQISVPVTALLGHSTVRGLAAFLAGTVLVTESEISPDDRELRRKAAAQRMRPASHIHE